MAPQAGGQTFHTNIFITPIYISKAGGNTFFCKKQDTVVPTEIDACGDMTKVSPRSPFESRQPMLDYRSLSFPPASIYPRKKKRKKYKIVDFFVSIGIFIVG